MRRRFLCFLLFAFSLPALAGGGTEVSDAWLRFIPGGAPSAGYFKLANRGDKTLSLVGAECPDFGMVMIHRTIERGGMSTMRPVHELTVEPGKSVEFAPGGYHLMLMRPKHPLRPGGRLPVTLRFGDGSRLSVEFVVKSPEAR
jgi:copper(I)-binding protein